MNAYTYVFLSIIAVFSIGISVHGNLISDVDASSFNNAGLDDLEQSTSSILVPFIENVGQENNKIKFYADTFAGRVYLTEDNLTYSLNADSGSYILHESFVFGSLIDFQGLNQHDMKINHFKGNDPDKWQSDIPAYNGVSLGTVWDGIDVSLYAHGNNVEKIFTVHPGYDTFAIQLSFDGITDLQLDENGDLVLFGDDNSNVISMSAPIAYQNINGEKIDVKVNYKIIDDTTYGFIVGDYDESEPLIIDPVIQSTFLGGNKADRSEDVAFDSDGNVFVSARTKSNVSIPDNYGLTGYQNAFSSNWDVVVFKVSNDLYTILAATYLGGSGEDSWASINVDSNGDVFVSGETESADFPGMDANSPQQTYSDKGDLFIVKLNNDLTTLHQATYYGVNDGYEENWDIQIDSSDNVFILGESNSTSIDGLSGGLQTTHANLNEATFVLKMSNDLQTVTQSTFFGSDMFDSSPSFNIHPTSGNIFVELSTNGTSTDWPTAVQNVLVNNFEGTPTNVERDEFTPDGVDGEGKDLYGHRTNPDHLMNVDIMIGSLSNDLQSITAARYLGGSALDSWMNFVIHSDGNLYMAGETYSSNFPTTSGVIYEDHGLSCNVAGDVADGSGNVCSNYETSTYDYLGAVERSTFVTVITPNLASIVSSTYIGIPYPNDPSSMGVDPDTGNVFVTGQKTSENDYNVLAGAIQEIHVGDVSMADAYVISLSNDLTNWIQSTYIGGSGIEDNLDIYFNSGYLFLSTETNSDDYPGIEYGAEPTRQGQKDIVISRMSPDLLANTDPTFQVQSMGGDKSVDFTINLSTSDSYVLGKIINIDDENIATVIEDIDLKYDPDDYDNLAVGKYNVTYSVTDEKGLFTDILETIHVTDDPIPTFEVLDMNGNTQTDDFETVLEPGTQYFVGSIQDISVSPSTSDVQYFWYENTMVNFSFDTLQLDEGTYYVKYLITDDTLGTTSEIVETITSFTPSIVESGSSDSCSDCIDPTFYYSQHRVIVKDGFVYNEYATDVISKHTETPPLFTDINRPNIMKLKVFDNGGTDNIKWVDVGFGLPGLYYSFDKAEVTIEIRLDNNVVKELIINDPHNLVDFGDITSNVVDCGYVAENCLQVTIPHSFRDKLVNDMIVVRASDYEPNKKTHYFNKGLHIEGTPDVSPTDKVFIQKYLGNPDFEWVDIVRVDRGNDIWASEDGIEFTSSYGGGYLRITPMGFDPNLE